MTMMSFDLEDGKPPVSFTLKPADVTRFMAFMAECSKATAAAPVLLSEMAEIQSWLKEVSRLPSGHKIDIPLEASAYVHTIQRAIAKATGSAA